MPDANDSVMIYTDGACSPNPGPGGYGVILDRAGMRREFSGGFRKTTNNRMEMIAAIEGIKALPEGEQPEVTILSDSRYLVDMFNGGYARQWRANSWQLASRKRAVNTDLWSALLDLVGDRPIRFEWVRGHSEHPENERCDALAVAARQGEALPPDEGYEAACRAAPQQLGLFE